MASCGGENLCKYLGFGPGGAVRCRHPKRACWFDKATWAMGCDDYVEWPGIGVGQKKYPDPVDIASYCNQLADVNKPSSQ